MANNQHQKGSQQQAAPIGADQIALARSEQSLAPTGASVSAQTVVENLISKQSQTLPSPTKYGNMESGEFNSTKIFHLSLLSVNIIYQWIKRKKQFDEIL